MDAAALLLLKKRINYHALLRVLGIPFVDRTDERALYFRCLNPDHEDKDPSMKLHYADRGDTKAGLWRCWNHGCRKWGRDVFDLVRVMRRCSLNDAVEFLRGLSDNVSSIDIVNALVNEDIARQGAVSVPNELDYPVMPFPSRLPEPNRPMPTDHPYLTTVRDPAPNPRHARDEDAVLVTDGGYQGYMVVPIRWMDGSIVTWQAIAAEPWAVERRAKSHPKSAQSKLYPHDAPVDRILYGLHRVRPGGIFVIDEGIFDTWRAWDAIDGFLPGAYGLGAMSNRFTPVQATIVRHLRPSEIVVLHDNEDSPDPPGLRLVFDIGGQFAYSTLVTVASVPKGYDPDDAGVDEVRKALAARVTYGRWVAEWATKPPGGVSPVSLSQLFP